MTAPAAHRPIARHIAMWLLSGIAMLCLGSVLAVSAVTWWVQRSSAHLLADQIRTQGRPPSAAAPVEHTTGRIEIPRVGLRAMVLRGTDRTTLRVAVGHVDGTAWPGETGNAALAGHRDTFFRPLRDVRVGDDVKFTSRSGVARYRVEALKVVGPDDVSVLDQRNGPMLTLITCYPFTFVGRAPSRLVVQARPVDSRITESRMTSPLTDQRD